MQYVPNDVSAYAMGMAASMGQFLLCAGAAGKRYAMPHASILMHQPHGGIGGTATDIRIQAGQILYLKPTLAERSTPPPGQTVNRTATHPPPTPPSPPHPRKASATDTHLTPP